MTTTPDSGKRGPKFAFPLPPPGFDCLRSSPSELAKFGLPPRPDGDKHPLMLKAWMRLFEPPVTFLEPVKFVEPVTVTRHLAKRQRIITRIAAPSRVEKSANWCGAEIVANSGNQFVQIFGEWTVPKPELPPPDERGPAGQTNVYRCVTWIGVDGNRRYLDASLPQIGTEQDLTVDEQGNASRQYFAWFQWWALTELQINRILLPVTIQEDLPVMAMIWVIDPHHVAAAFRTFGSSNQITVMYEEAPFVRTEPGGSSIMRPAIAGATVEWIHERPLFHGTPSLFAKYSPVTFRNCVAGMGPAPGIPTSEQTLTAPFLFRMFDVPGDAAPRTRLTSMPTRISETSFGARYGGFTT
jgi:hypothetical protein